MKIFNLINITILFFSFLFFPSAFSQQLASNNKTEFTGISDRKIESLDMLLVHVFGEPEFSGPDNAGLKLRVSSAGEVSLYLLGTIKVAGKTPSEAEKHIRSLLMKDFIRDPHVLVQVETYRITNVTIMGQVSKPGVVPLPAEQRIDILAGIAIAGGFTKLAKTSKIDLTRNGGTTTFSLDKLKQEKDINNKVWLKTGDLVYIHESAF
jgi:polysaccharide export outer membrane protein